VSRSFSSVVFSLVGFFLLARGLCHPVAVGLCFFLCLDPSGWGWLFGYIWIVLTKIVSSCLVQQSTGSAFIPSSFFLPLSGFHQG
jgi:hypothetical protein